MPQGSPKGGVGCTSQQIPKGGAVLDGSEQYLLYIWPALSTLLDEMKYDIKGG